MCSGVMRSTFTERGGRPTAGVAAVHVDMVIPVTMWLIILITFEDLLPSQRSEIKDSQEMSGGVEVHRHLPFSYHGSSFVLQLL